METKKATAAAALLGILSISFALTPLALATSSSPSYAFELTGRVEYVAAPGTANPFGPAGRAVYLTAPPVALAEAVAWVPASSISTSPGHGL